MRSPILNNWQPDSRCGARVRRAIITVAISMSLSTPTTAAQWQFDGASNAELGNPHDLTLDANGTRLLVSDLNNDRIAIFDAQTLAFVGSFAEGELSAPHDVALGPDGRIYVADTGNDRIAVFSLDGTHGQLVNEFHGSIRRPEGVAVADDGRVYASGAASGNVVLFAASGAQLAETSGLSAPHDVVLGANGNVWIADAGNDRLLELDAELQVVTVLEGQGYAFNGPRYMDMSEDGELVVADKYAHSVKVIDRDGNVVQVLGSGRAGLGENVFRTPEGVELRGRLAWFSDSGNNRLVRYRRR